MTYLEQINALKHGEMCYLGDDAEVWNINEILILFEIPYGGGEPQFSSTFHKNDAQKIVYTVKTWL